MFMPFFLSSGRRLFRADEFFFPEKVNTKSDKSFYVYSCIDEIIYYEGMFESVVLAIKNLHCTIEQYNAPAGKILAALAPEMYDLVVGHVKNFPARLFYSIAPVQVVAVHDVILVEDTDLLDDLPSDHHAAPGDGVHFAGLVVIAMCHQVLAEAFGSGEKPVQSQKVKHRRRYGGKASPALVLERAVPVQYLWAAGTDVRMLFHKPDQTVESAVLDYSVIVQRQNVPSLRRPDALVVCLDKSRIVGIFYKSYRRKSIFNHLCTSVGRAVIDDDNFEARLRSVGVDGIQAALEVFFVIVVDDGN